MLVRRPTGVWEAGAPGVARVLSKRSYFSYGGTCVGVGKNSAGKKLYCVLANLFASPYSLSHAHPGTSSPRSPAYSHLHTPAASNDLSRRGLAQLWLVYLPVARAPCCPASLSPCSRCVPGSPVKSYAAALHWLPYNHLPWRVPGTKRPWRMAPDHSGARLITDPFVLAFDAPHYTTNYPVWYYRGICRGGRYWWLHPSNGRYVFELNLFSARTEGAHNRAHAPVYLVR